MKPYLFFREGHFYPIEYEDDVKAVRGALENPGTLRVVDPVTMHTVWACMNPPMEIDAWYDPVNGNITKHSDNVNMADMGWVRLHLKETY